MAASTFRLLVSLAAGLVAILATGYAILTPAYEAPDETAHLSFTHLVARDLRLPVLGVDPVYEAGQPPLYYVLTGLLVRIAGLPTPMAPTTASALAGLTRFRHTSAEMFPWHGEYLTLHVVRFLSVPMAIGTVLVAAALGLALTGSRRIGALAALLLAGIPQFTYLAGMANNDNLAALLGGLTILASIRTIQQQSPCTWRTGLRLGGIAGLAALSKSTCAPLAGVAVAVLALKARGKPRWALPLVAALGVTVGWWYLRNLFLYGEPTGQFTLFRIAPDQYNPRGVLDPYFVTVWPAETFRSFWFVIGWMTVRAPAWYYRIWAIVSVAAAIGLLGAVLARTVVRRSLVVALAALGVIIALYFFYNLQAPQYQARYLFPAITVIAALLAIGVDHATTLLPARARPFAMIGLLTGLIALNGHLLLGWVPRQLAG